MRTKKPLLIALLLFTWSFVSYFLLLRQTAISSSSLSSPSSRAAGIQNELNGDRDQQHDLLIKLNQLEENIRYESRLHDQLLHKLLSIIRLKEEQSADVPHIVEIVHEDVRNVIDGKKLETINQKIGRAHVTRLGAKNIAVDDNVIGAANGGSIQYAQDGGAAIDKTVYNVVEDQAQVDTQLKQMTKEMLPKFDFKGPVIPILVFACNRISVRNCLDNLIQYRPNANQFPIIVSQDCDDEATRTVVQSYKEVTLMRQPDQSDIFVLPKDKKFKGYYKIARHYGWALNTTFKAGFDYVVIVEDDLNVAPDFFDYFLATHELLKNDSSLWCVSAWNDNGKVGNIDESGPELLYRTDFFPGLGWMLSRDLWSELSVKWPIAFWDDWIRHPEQRKERACIRPEISRTRTFGKIGVSNGLFFEKHLRYIKLSEHSVSFTKMNLTYLLKENYDKQFLSQVYSYPVITFEELRRGLVKTKNPVRIQYNTKDQYKRTAKLLGLMDDLKSGVPRTGYHGIVSIFYNNQRIYLAPNSNWKGYDLSWS